MILTFNSGFGGGGEALPPTSCTNINAIAGNGIVSLNWSDPENLIVDGIMYAEWKGTRVVRKQGGYPQNENDGVTVVNNSIKDAYKTNSFDDTGLSNGTTYYYGFFPYSPDGVYNRTLMAKAQAMPLAHKVVGIRIDETNKNPATAITYTDDSYIKTPESPEWDDFFGYYPVLLKDGKEVGKLDPNNFGKFANGTTADITSGDAGDVMIAFPRKGIKFERNGNFLEIRMTDDLNDPDYSYYAHTYCDAYRDKFYMGAYMASDTNTILRSLSGKTPTKDLDMTKSVRYAQAHGDGYEIIGHFQRTFISAMYLLKYKDRDSSNTIGFGNCNGTKPGQITGSTDTNGMAYGTTTSNEERMKLFGIEDLWGNGAEWLGGIIFRIVVDNPRDLRIFISTGKFSDSADGYKMADRITEFSRSGETKTICGTNETGFIKKLTVESGDIDDTTLFQEFYCDAASVPSAYGNDAYIAAGSPDTFNNRYESANGIFCIRSQDSNYKMFDLFTRLMYL